MVVGITGNYCSGKNSACQVFAKHGYEVIDVDKIGHEALEARQREVVAAFGEEVLKDGRIYRKKLGNIVFGNEEKKKKLESIVHPWMIRRVKSLTGKNENIVINAALLIEMCLFVLCDFVIGIDVEEKTALRRGISRDMIPPEEALKRLRAQIPLKEKIYYVDKIIENSGSLQEFREKIRETVDYINKLA